MKNFALTFDTEKDKWEESKGFLKREIPMPFIDEKSNPADALAVVLKINYAGVCGTDRGIWSRNVFRDLIHDSLTKEGKTMRILGHEFVGEVLQAGSQVENLYGIKVSENVSGDSHVTCGRCFQCHIGQEEVCQEQKILGISTDGVFANYVKIPAKNLWQVDFSRVRPEIAAVLDPFGNAVHACSKVDLIGKRVVVLGCGPIGMFTVLLSRLFGASKVIAVDRNERNLEICAKLGAHFKFLLSKKDTEVYIPDQELLSSVKDLTYGKGADIVFEMAGSNESVNNALSIVRSGGDVALFGLKDGDFMIPKFKDIIVKGVTLHGVIGRQIFNTWQIAQRVLSDKANGVQDKIWEIVLNKGEGTVVDFDQYTAEMFKEKMERSPKILVKM